MILKTYEYLDKKYLKCVFKEYKRKGTVFFITHESL